MSLRDRLTVLNVVLVGGLFVFFGVVAYVAVSLLLYKQIDDSLEAAARQVVKQANANVSGQMLEVIAPNLSLTANIYIQVWSGETLVDAYPRLEFAEPIDPAGIRSAQAIYRNVKIGEWRARSLSVPLTLDGRVIGAVQVATNLDVVETARSNLLSVLVFATMIGITIASIASRGTVSQLIAPLDSITAAADQINRADDLSRRVPYEGSQEDEVGQLVHAFNQTLERLEGLFTSQQRFLADVSHELRTPLTVIKGNVDLMRRTKEFDPEMLDSIEQESGRLTRLVLDLLLLAKAETGQLPLNKSAVEFDSLLLEVFNEMRILAGGRVHLKLMEIDQLQVYGDRDRLKQVLINLIANAIKFTPAGGDIFLSLSRASDHAKLIVRDTGPGIPTDDLPYIFERFYRAEKSRTRSAASGFGLGLSIAHWIVEQHGGRIEVNSQEGKGTTFAIWVPLGK
ncbi:MAG: Adaptive-response sensory-kinase SasA [Anaerolineales bacterium]|nr:Adaptive-response sensory-kinase SasA [Anaerolineales bacterium]